MAVMKRKAIGSRPFSWKPFAIAAGSYAANKLITSYKGKQPLGGPAGPRPKRISYKPGVTQQHDYRIQYRKKRMPRYKKRAWKNFVRKVQAVSDKDRGLATYVFNKQVQVSTLDTIGGVRQQCVAAIHLYGKKGSENLSNNLVEIAANDLEVIFAQDKRLSSSKSQKPLFHSAILDMTFFNPNPGVIELDVYDVVYGKNVPEVTRFTDSLNNFMANNSLDPRVAGSSLTWHKAFIQHRGVTPFENGTVASALRFKVLSKTKYFIGQNQTITKQIRDARNRHITAEYLGNSEGFCMSGTTRTVLVVAKPTYNSGQSDTIYLNIGVTRSYKFTCEGEENDTNIYIP